MNRRGFLTKLGVGSATCLIAPSLITPDEEHVTDIIDKEIESQPRVITLDTSNHLDIKQVIEIYRQTGIIYYKV